MTALKPSSNELGARQFKLRSPSHGRSMVAVWPIGSKMSFGVVSWAAFTTSELIWLPMSSRGAPRSTPKRAWLSMGGVLGHGLRLRIIMARCFREIGVLQPLALRNKLRRGTKAGPLWGGGLGKAVRDSQNAWQTGRQPQALKPPCRKLPSYPARLRLENPQNAETSSSFFAVWLDVPSRRLEEAVVGLVGLDASDDCRACAMHAGNDCMPAASVIICLHG